MAATSKFQLTVKANSDHGYLKDIHYSKSVNSLWSHKSITTELTLDIPPPSKDN